MTHAPSVASRRPVVALSAALATTLFLAASVAAGEETEAAERAGAVKILRSLSRGEYAEAIPLADAAYRLWRDRYAGKPVPQMTAAMQRPPELDPKVTYVRSPSPAAIQGAKEIAEAIAKIKDPKAVPFLVAVKTHEISLHACAAAMEIGARLCQEGRLAEGVAAYHAAAVAWDARKIEPDTREWAYPRLAGERMMPRLWGAIEAAIPGRDVEELIRAYRAVSADDAHAAQLAWMILSGATSFDKDRPSADKYLPLMAEALNDKRPRLRKWAAQLLHARNSRFTDLRGVGQLLARHLDDPDPTARFLIANSAVRAGDSRGLPVLFSEPLPKDATPFDYPLMTIGQLNMRQATPWIVALAGRHPELRQECVRAFYVMGDPRAVAFLGKTLLDDGEPALTRRLAASALGWTMDDAALPYMKAALRKADARLADSILAALNIINPELAMPVWIESMRDLGLLEAPDLAGRNLGMAWLQLHFYSGHGDVIGQYRKDKEALLSGMKEYWQGRRKLHDLSCRIRYCRFAEPDAQKEIAAWRELAEVVKTVPQRSFYQLYPLGPPDEQDAQARTARFVTRDGKLVIEQRFTQHHAFSIAIRAPAP